MLLSGQDRERCGDIVHVSSHVCGRRSNVAFSSVACVGTRNRISEVAFYPCKCGVPHPVHAYLLGFHPLQVATQSHPEVVITTGCYLVPILVSKKLTCLPLTTFRVFLQETHQRRRDWLPSNDFAFLVKSDQRLLSVKIIVLLKG